MATFEKGKVFNENAVIDYAEGEARNLSITIPAA